MGLDRYGISRLARYQGDFFEWTTLLAMLVYWMVGMGIIKLLFMGKTISTPEAAVKLDNDQAGS